MQNIKLIFYIYIANNPSTQNSLSSQRTQNTSDQKGENKKANAAFEHSRDQRIETAKQGNDKQTNSTKTEKNANKSLQVAGNQVFLISSCMSTDCTCQGSVKCRKAGCLYKCVVKPWAF